MNVAGVGEGGDVGERGREAGLEPLRTWRAWRVSNTQLSQAGTVPTTQPPSWIADQPPRLGSLTRSRLIAQRGLAKPMAGGANKLDGILGQSGKELGELVAEGAIGDGDAGVDGGTGRPGCRPDSKRRYSSSVDSVRSRSKRRRFHGCLPTSGQSAAVVRVEAQTSVGQAAHVLTIQIAINPAHLSAGGLFDNANRTLRVLRLCRSITRNFMAEHSPAEIGTAAHRRPERTRSSDRGLRAMRRSARESCSRSRAARLCAACWPLPFASASKAR